MKQGILQQNALQRYPIGLRWAEGDRVFRYCKAGTAIPTPMKAGHCGNLPTEVFTAAVAYAAGAIKIAILDTAIAHGVDYYKDGYLWIQEGNVSGQTTVSGIYRMHKIKSSTASDAESVTLTLDDPLTRDVAASTWVTAWPNIYSNILATSSTFMSNVCVPLIPVTIDYYFWGQTWGPCFGTVYSSTPGRVANQRDVYFNIDGALMTGAEIDLSSVLHQRAGFLITNTEPGGEGYGDQLYMLQLAP